MTPEGCQHKFAYDPEGGELVCERGCGWSVPAFQRLELVYAPAGRKLTSPSVVNQNLGSDQDAVIKELSRGAGNSSTADRVHFLSGALRFFGTSRHQDEDLVLELSNRLHGRVSDPNLAAIALVFRKALKQLEKERRAKALTLLDQMTGGLRP